MAVTLIAAFLSAGCATTTLRDMSTPLHRIDDLEAETMARVLAYSKGEYGADSVSGFVDFRKDILRSGVGPDDLALIARPDDPGTTARWDLLKRAGGATDADIVAARGLAASLAATPAFFGRKIEEAGAKDGQQVSYLTLVLMILGGAAGGMSQGSNTKSGSPNPRTSGGQSHPTSHPTPHVAATPHVASSPHASTTVHAPASPGVSTHATATAHEAPAGREAHAEHEERHHPHHHPHAELKVRIQERAPIRGVRAAGLVPVVVVPGAAFPVASYTAIGPDESSACDEAYVEVAQANACVADPDNLEVSECTCADFVDAAQQQQSVCSIAGSVQCRAEDPTTVGVAAPVATTVPVEAPALTPTPAPAPPVSSGAFYCQGMATVPDTWSCSKQDCTQSAIEQAKRTPGWTCGRREKAYCFSVLINGKIPNTTCTGAMSTCASMFPLYANQAGMKVVHDCQETR